MEQISGLEQMTEKKWKEIPTQVREEVKLRVLDCLGSILGATDSKAGKIACFTATQLWQGEGASIITSGEECSPLGAAYGNSSLASALDIDDGYRLACGHPGSTIIPAAIAVGEDKEIKGRKLLKAVLVGYEIATRTGEALYEENERFFGSGSWSCVGAAGAAGCLLNLPQERIKSALGIAESYAPLSPTMKSIENGSMVKESIGWAAMTGIASAYLAKKGFTGVRPKLFESSHSAKLESLGNSFRISETYIKPFACCRWAHPAIEAVSEIVNNYDIGLNEIAKIEVNTFEEGLSLDEKKPKTPEAAQYSLPFAVAAYLKDKKVGPKQINCKSIKNEEILNLADKVEIKQDDSINNRFPKKCLAKVKITSTNNENYYSDVKSPRGSKSRPLAEKDIRHKFHWLAGSKLNEGEVRSIEKLVGRLDKEPSIDNFVQRFPKVPSAGKIDDQP